VPPVRGSIKLVPQLYLPSQVLGGLGARQGMHMLDVSSPELGVLQGKPPVTFNTSWILGGLPAGRPPLPAAAVPAAGSRLPCGAWSEDAECVLLRLGG
jgi:hypothetical protein